MLLPPCREVGQFVSALDQLVFRSRALTCTENYLLSLLLEMWAGRYQPITGNPADPEQKQTDSLPDTELTVFDIVIY